MAADAVVWSTNTAPGFIASKAPFLPRVTSHESESRPTQANTISASWPPRPAWARTAPPYSPTQRSRLVCRAVEDGHVVAGARQMARHRIAHHAQADECSSASHSSNSVLKRRMLFHHFDLRAARATSAGRFISQITTNRPARK